MAVSEPALPPGSLNIVRSSCTRNVYRFPIREYGLNYAAQPLQKHEIKAMKDDETINRRILASYQLMLDFYGMRLEDESTGLISRSKGYASQYKNLCSTYSCRPGLVLRSTPFSTGRSCLVVRFMRLSVVPKSYLIRPLTS